MAAPRTATRTVMTPTLLVFSPGNYKYKHNYCGVCFILMNSFARFRRKYYNKITDHKTVYAILVLIILLLVIAVIVIACLRRFNCLPEIAELSFR